MKWFQTMPAVKLVKGMKVVWCENVTRRSYGQVTTWLWESDGKVDKSRIPTVEMTADMELAEMGPYWRPETRGQEWDVLDCPENRGVNKEVVPEEWGEVCP